MELKSLFERCLSIQYIHLNENSADYACEKIDNVLYIYFQWSHGKEDWKNNFSFAVKPYRGMDIKWYCHGGFLKVWKTIKDNIDKSIFDNIEKVVIVGYSHGAAIASLCHEWIWFNYPNLRENITGYGFGCPRVYWNWFWKFPKELQERWKNFHPIRNCSDIVTHLPPTLFGFRHVNKVIKIHSDWHKFPIKSHYSENYKQGIKNKIFKSI